MSLWLDNNSNTVTNNLLLTGAGGGGAITGTAVTFPNTTIHGALNVTGGLNVGGTMTLGAAPAIGYTGIYTIPISQPGTVHLGEVGATVIIGGTDFTKMMQRIDRTFARVTELERALLSTIFALTPWRDQGADVARLIIDYAVEEALISISS